MVATAAPAGVHDQLVLSLWPAQMTPIDLPATSSHREDHPSVPPAFRERRRRGRGGLGGVDPRCRREVPEGQTPSWEHGNCSCWPVSPGRWASPTARRAHPDGRPSSAPCHRRPAQARRLWSQAEVITAMGMHARAEATARWRQHAAAVEALGFGRAHTRRVLSADHCRGVGTVTHAIFPAAGRHEGSADILAASGMDTLEPVSRMQSSDVDDATIEALNLTADQLCSDYRSWPATRCSSKGRTGCGG